MEEVFLRVGHQAEGHAESKEEQKGVVLDVGAASAAGQVFPSVSSLFQRSRSLEAESRRRTEYRSCAVHAAVYRDVRQALAQRQTRPQSRVVRECFLFALFVQNALSSQTIVYPLLILVLFLGFLKVASKLPNPPAVPMSVPAQYGVPMLFPIGGSTSAQLNRAAALVASVASLEQVQPQATTATNLTAFATAMLQGGEQQPTSRYGALFVHAPAAGEREHYTVFANTTGTHGHCLVACTTLKSVVNSCRRVPKSARQRATATGERQSSCEHRALV